MNENSIRDMTLAKWAGSVWERELRGVPMPCHESALAYCMRQHREWRQHWNQLATHSTENPKTISVLVHVYNDASVKVQLDRNDPPEINSLYQAMRAKGVSDMDALHAIAFVLQEQTWNAKNSGRSFDIQSYVEKVQSSIETFIEHRELLRCGR